MHPQLTGTPGQHEEKTDRREHCADNAAESAAPRAVSQSLEARRHPGPKRILVVDDDRAVRESLLAALRSEGYAVVSAAGGLQALALSARIPPDLVLLDLNLPGQDGWDVFERLTSENPLLPVIIITGRPNQLFTACNAGVGALLEKPLDIPILLQTIRTLLEEPAEVRLARLAGHNAPFHYLRQGGQCRVIKG